MELRHLKYFIAVAEELHFSKAAARLCIVQPALSRQVKELENELGVMLLKRTKRSVALTEAGKYYYDEAINILRLLDNIKERAQQMQSGSAGRIKIGHVGSAMLTTLPKLITRLRKDYPGIRIELHEMTAMTQLQMLKTGKIDLGFLRVPREDDDFVFETIFAETYSLVLPSSHKITSRNFKGLKQVAAEKFILPPRSAGERYYDNIIAICNAAGFSPYVAHESVNEDASIRLVENNLGISIFPSSFKNAFNAKVKFIELKRIPQRLRLSIAWNKNNSNPALQTLINIIRNTRF